MNRASIVLLIALITISSGCAPRSKPLALGELDRPQSVMVVTIDQKGTPSVRWPGNFQLGMLFGALGGAIDGAIQGSREQRMSAKLAADIGEWDFRGELHSIFLSTTVPPAGWRWVDGATLEQPLMEEIVHLYAKKDATAPLLTEYAAAQSIDKVLVVDPTFYGIDRNKGYVVTLRGVLFEPTVERTTAWEGYSKERKGAPAGLTVDYDFKGANDAALIRERLLARSTVSVQDLVANLKGE